MVSSSLFYGYWLLACMTIVERVRTNSQFLLLIHRLYCNDYHVSKSIMPDHATLVVHETDGIETKVRYGLISPLIFLFDDLWAVVIYHRVE